MIETSKGKESLTVFRVLLKGADRTLVEARPKTGRTHQIRVHCAKVGHPILGERVYAESATWPAQALHAYRLDLAHPVSGEKLALRSAPRPLARFGLDFDHDGGKDRFAWRKDEA